jgi:beta-glucosidase
MQGRTYRYFSGIPLYPFGYGLSYTHFTYSQLQLSSTQLQAGASLTVSATVRNDGDRGGDEVVQVYLDAPDSASAPRHSLVGFRRVHLGAAETRRVSFELTPRQLSTVDASGHRDVEAGHYRLFVGGGQPGGVSEGVATTFAITGHEALPQ